MIAAFIGFPFSSYQCWWSWAPVKTSVGTALYLSVVGLGAGVIGIAITTLSKAALTSSGLVNAVLSGIAGALLLRADIRPRTRAEGPRAVAAIDIKQAASIVGTVVTYTSSSLDALTKREAERWFSSVSDVQLARQARRLVSDLGTRNDCTKAFKDKTSQRVVEEIEALGKEADRDAGKAHLVSFCTDYIASRHMVKIAHID